MILHESAEMYLETILVLSQRLSEVRAIDIVNALDYKKSSVSIAMKNLRENGYVQVGDGGHITLTPKGQAIAQTMLERHTLLSEWLVQLGVDKTIASEDACRIEHVISPESFDAIKKHTGNMKKHQNP